MITVTIFFVAIIFANIIVFVNMRAEILLAKRKKENYKGLQS